MCRMLLKHDADINARDNWGRVPLHRVANPNTDDHQLDVMQLLLDQGTDVNIQDNVGSTPLHHSSRWHKGIWFSSGGTVEGSRLLLRHGANIDAENDEGKTPLRVALERGHEEMAEFLSGLGAK
ncbi:ankyrin repeat protein [Russula dissimulans]|nr:ankyrin repeat protein [Russula dissimulans]